MNMTDKSPDTPVPNYLKCLLWCHRRRQRKLQKTAAANRDASLPLTSSHGRVTSERKHSDLYQPCQCSHSSRSGRYWHVNGEMVKHLGKNSDSDQSLMKRRDPYSDKTFDGMQETKLDDRDRPMEYSRHESERELFMVPHIDDVTDGSDDIESVTWLDVGSAVDTLLFWCFLFITLSSTSVVLILFLMQ